MALAGRILRRGLSGVENYTLDETELYDNTNPAGSVVGGFAESTLLILEQPLDAPIVAGVNEIDAEGLLITFARFPHFFEGVVVKIRPTYTGLEVPFLEVWLYTVVGGWVKRRRVSLTNPFTGTESDRAKIFDLRFNPVLEDITKVWITMDPGAVGAPSMRFAVVQCYGFCTPTIPKVAGCPALAKIDGVWVAVDDNGDPTGAEVPEPCLPSLCLDDPAACLVPILDFDPDEPPVPPLDLCDSDSITTFRASLSVEDAEFFDQMLDVLDSLGYFEEACDPPEDPYFDPEDIAPATEPPEPPDPVCDPYHLIYSNIWGFSSTIPAQRTIPVVEYLQQVWGDFIFKFPGLITAFEEIYPDGITIPAMIFPHGPSTTYINTADYPGPPDGFNTNNLEVILRGGLLDIAAGCIIALRVEVGTVGTAPADIGPNDLAKVIPYCPNDGATRTMRIMRDSITSGLTKWTGTLSPLMEQMCGDGWFFMKYTNSIDTIPGVTLFRIHPRFDAANPLRVNWPPSGFYFMVDGFTYIVRMKIFVPMTVGCELPVSAFDVRVSCLKDWLPSVLLDNPTNTLGSCWP